MRIAAVVSILVLESGCGFMRYVGAGTAGVGVVGIVVGASNLDSCSGVEGCKRQNGGSLALIAIGTGLVVAGGVIVLAAEQADVEETQTLFDGSEED